MTQTDARTILCAGLSKIYGIQEALRMAGTVIPGIMNDFNQMGYRITHFGGRDYQISGIPADMYTLDPGELFMSVIADATDWSGIRESELIKERIASMSCKAAIKGNHTLSSAEMETLFLELMELDEPYHCPHGRPTMISFTRDELDKKFKRIVG